MSFLPNEFLGSHRSRQFLGSNIDDVGAYLAPITCAYPVIGD